MSLWTRDGAIVATGSIRLRTSPSVAERKLLGGYLFRDGPVVVRPVALGLRTSPELFPDIAIDGADSG